jgi:hypothetical protein
MAPGHTCRSDPGNFVGGSLVFSQPWTNFLEIHELCNEEITQFALPEYSMKKVKTD